jgi:hypothetical protein
MSRYDLIIRGDVVAGAEGPAEADLAVEDGKRVTQGVDAEHSGQPS